MTIQTPEAFWLLLLLIPLVFIALRSFDLGRKQLGRLTGQWREHRIQAVFLLKTFFSTTAFVLALVFLIISLAGLNWGATPVEENSTGLEVALCVDVSRSMLAQDLRPNRLKKAAEAIHFLSESLPGARFSLTVFKGGAITLVPLTLDIHHLRRILDELSPQLVTSPGSQMEDGLRQALATLSQPSSRKKVIVLLSDGENREGNPLAVAKEASLQGVEIFTLGLGTSEGAPLPLPNGTFILDGFGNKVISRLNADLLMSLSRETLGRSFVYTDPQVLSELVQPLEILSNPASQTGVMLESVPRYRIFLLISLGFFLLFLVIRIVKWQKLF